MAVSAIFLKNAWLSKLYFFSSSMNYLTTRTRTHLRVLLLQHVLEVEQNQQLVVHALHLQRLLADVAQRTIRK